MTEFVVSEVPVADARPLRQRVLRPHQTLDEVAANEPDRAVAFGAVCGDQLLAVGIIGVDGDPSRWRVRGMATDPVDAAATRGGGRRADVEADMRPRRCGWAVRRPSRQAGAG